MRRLARAYGKTTNGKRRNREKMAKRRAKVRGARIERLPGRYRDQLLESQLGRCAYCQCNLGQLDQVYHVDHVIPLAKGGAHALANLVLACPACNGYKRDLLPVMFLWLYPGGVGAQGKSTLQGSGY